MLMPSIPKGETNAGDEILNEIATRSFRNDDSRGATIIYDLNDKEFSTFLSQFKS
jgi:hypothetical protein